LSDQKHFLERFIEKRWYSRPGALYVLAPLEFLFRFLARLRRRRLEARAYQPQLPLLILGNISVGGTGKTPLIIALVKFLQSQGYKPAVISRAYLSAAAKSKSVHRVTEGDGYAAVGDEPLEIYSRTQCPVFVGGDRVALVKHIEQQGDCDLILSDDGLQDYRLGRSVEVVVVDGQRAWGNGHCLPLGPLREPPKRVDEADLILVNGGHFELSAEHAYTAKIVTSRLLNLRSGEELALRDIQRLQPFVAIAGLGNPEKFFHSLVAHGAVFERKAFPDHYPIQERDLQEFTSKQVVMTGKDAVKCREFAKDNYWMLEVELVPEAGFFEQVLTLLHRSRT